MSDLHKFNPKLRVVWHPSPTHDNIITENITLIVREGDPKGQLSDGNFIEI